MLGSDEPAGALGAVAVGAFVFLVLVPEAMRSAAQVALSRDRLRLAEWLTALRELLQPFAGVHREREVLRALRDVRLGDTRSAIARLQAAVPDDGSDPDRRFTVHEQLVQLLLFERRSREAIEQCERTLGGAYVESRPGLMALLVRAYAEMGNLRTAAGLLGRLEASPMVHDARALPILNHARLAFLAFAGRAPEVEELLAPGASLLWGEGAHYTRAYLLGVAFARAGDVERARVELVRAVGLAGRRERLRAVAESALEGLEDVGLAGGAEGDPGVAALADAVVSRARALKAAPRPRFGVRATPVTLLTAAVYVAMYVVFAANRLPRPLALLRFGANYRAAVLAGEPWRLVTAALLHPGILQLVGDIYVLTWVGRLLEPILGHRKFLVLLVVCGLGTSVGTLAWRLGSAGVPSVSAPGAVFGLVAGGLALLLTYHDAWPLRVRRWVLVNLLTLAVLDLFISLRAPGIEPVGLIGGMLAGILAAPMLSSHRRRARSGMLREGAINALVVAFVATVAGGLVAVGITPVARTLSRLPCAFEQRNGIAVSRPAHWNEDASGPHRVRFFEPLLGPTGQPLVSITISRPDPTVDPLEMAASGRRVDVPAGLLPPGAVGRAELLAVSTGGAMSAWRMTALVRRNGADAVVEITIPGAVTSSYVPVIERLIRSISIRG